MNIADYILFSIILITMIVGGIKGLVMTAYGLASTVMSYFLAFKFAVPIRDLLVGTSFYRNIESRVDSLVESLLPNMDSLEQSVLASLEDMPFPEAVKGWMLDGIDFNTVNTKSEVLQNLTSTITAFIVAVIVGFVLFILLTIIFKLLRGFVRKIAQLPILKQVDSVVGAVLGAVFGVLIVYIALLIISGFQTTEVMHIVHDIVLESRFASILYNNNILLSIFS